ncbi:hypothetical protein Clacol_007125 [Clathrus columnatus]|uniref:F-box domain-containing protein n=1 Tax=Clathrus columnatus TaxID=1419009 RepID=A0AAV5AJM5_9AGAM|nr:hypothetical protein Clacol_007125 [Clathrus columnatus]
MSTQFITPLPLEILFLIIGAINNCNDLLSFALACRLIIPDKLKYFRISGLVENPSLRKHLLKNLYLCRGIHEFELMDYGVHAQRTRGSFQKLNHPTYVPVVSDLSTIIRNMVNLSRVKFSWRGTFFEIFRNFLDALGDSGCRLEEFAIFWDIPESNWYGNPAPLVAVMKLEDLQIWTKLDRTALQKLSIQIETCWTWNRNYVPSSQATWLGDMLSDTPKLTHLNLTIQLTSPSINILDYTWPYLENLIIGDSNIFPATGVSPPPSKFTEFFKRHPKLTTLSLPYFVYSPGTSFYITLECLPKLESLAYDGLLGEPSSLVLSPASAKRLRHLMMYDDADSLRLPENMDIYKELTSLQTLCFTLDQRGVYHYNLDRVLEILAVHATDLQKIHIPMGKDPLTRRNSTLSVLQWFPKLTHLSGVRTNDINRSNFYLWGHLEYVIYAKDDDMPNFSRITRKNDHEGEFSRAEVVSGKNPDCDIRTWGNFYNKI